MWICDVSDEASDSFDANFFSAFECGWATDDRRWCTPQSLRKRHVAAAVNL